MCHMCVGHVNLILKAEICLRTHLMKAMKCDGYQCMGLGTDIIFAASCVFFQLEILEGN